MTKFKVLVVDDDKEMADLVATIFQRDGYRAEAVNSGKGAFEYLSRERPDLIILDLLMPEMDGYEVCKRLKSCKATSMIPVLMLTVDDSQKHRIAAFDTGIDDYIAKPFNAEELLARAKSHLRRTHELKRAQKKQRKPKIKNILVTGGAGFIGSHLARALAKAKYNVHIIDDFSTGRMENIDDILKKKNVHLTTGSITDEVILSKAIEQADMVYHLAATVGVKHVVDSALDTIVYDTLGTLLVLKYASSKGIKVLLTSTSEVYGKTKEIPFREDSDIIIGPPHIHRWSYACSKLLDEFLSIAYFRERNLQVIIVRLFNVVGPGQVGHYGMVLPRFFKSAYRNKPIHIYGTGKQSRCFTYIDDAITLLMRIAKSEKASGEVINLGSAEEISILELANKVKKITGSSSKLVFEDYNKFYGRFFQDVKRRVPETTRLKKIVGAMPMIGLDEILRRMKRFFDEHPEELQRI
ncbi:MAG: NAD-dependent epimerase/dehydratase family protein [Pseudomonadota bacterium]